MCAWVVVSDEDKVRDAGLVPEPPINAKDTYRINKIAAFHKYMARGYEKRLVSEDSFQNGHGIAGLFWHHAFNSSGSSSTPMLKRVPGLPREKAQVFWMIQKDDPVVAEVIKTATQEMKKKKGNTKSMYSNVVLKLTSLVGRGTDEPVPVQNRIKM